MSLLNRQMIVDNLKLSVPMSDATNGYDLLTDVIRAIREEPRRFDMSDWLQIGQSVLDRYRQDRRPSCGTVCCIAGWTYVLGTPAREDRTVREEDWNWNVHTRASILLLGPDPLPLLGELPEDEQEKYKTSDGYFTDEYYEELDRRNDAIRDDPRHVAWQSAKQELTRLFHNTTPEAVYTGVDEGGWPVYRTPQIGTPEYVEYFVPRIQEFQEKYADLLRANVITRGA